MRAILRGPVCLALLTAAGVGLAMAEFQATPLNTYTGAVTVRLFSSQQVASLSVLPVGAGVAMVACPGCPRRVVSERIEVVLEQGKLLVTGKNLGRISGANIELDGKLQVVADPQGRRATAAGVWRMTASHDGLMVLLTLPVERYVAAALSGESAPDEPAESLQAMAVIIRTFAVENRDRHASEGFDLCDNTHCQVLRLDHPRAEVEQAVLDTTGEYLWSGNQRARVYYTQNCGGRTESASDVWPQENGAYLASRPDPYCVRNAAAVWHSEVPVAALRRVMLAQGWQAPSEVASVQVTKRSESGRALLLEIGGGAKRVQVSASSLRFALDRELGWNQIRSDWYQVSLAGGVLRFDGKGFGHGVGLCQAGAKEMALEHHSAAEILGFYFPRTHIAVTAADQGWKAIERNGWILRTVWPSAELEQTGDRAWTEAAKLMGSGKPVRAVVYAFPSTELFRQATGEPGWVRGSSRAGRVFLQPEAVLSRNGSVASTLLHEFLHVLVEQEASDKAPLWLREGLVEALAEPDSSPNRGEMGPDGVEQMNAGLADRRNSAEARLAHERAGQVVRQFLAQYGLATVRNWLRTSVPPQGLLAPGSAR